MKTIVSELGSVVAEIHKEKLLEALTKGDDLSLITLEIEKYLNKVGIEAIRELLESANAHVLKDPNRIREWEIKERFLPSTLNTIFGNVNYERTYYKNKETGEHKFLSDESLGIKATDKTGTCLKARNIEEAIGISYRKSGKKASRAIETSGQTVMNHIRELGSISNDAAPIKLGPGREIKTLYIEADEDHTASQTGKAMEPKLVYVHEGKEFVGSEKRIKLKNVRYFSGIYPKSEELWHEVLDYIDEVYNYDSIERIYVSGDGALWIKSGAEYINKGIYVVDKYHLMKYVRQAGAHVENGVSCLLEGIFERDKDYFRICIDTLKGLAETETKVEAIKDSEKYILNVWDSIDNYSNSDYMGCSAEGHISHILSDRLSSRPMAWRKKGADQMSRLRVFNANGGNIHQLLLDKKRDAKLLNEQLTMDADIQSLRKTGTSQELVHNITVLNVGKGTSLAKTLKAYRGY